MRYTVTCMVKNTYNEGNQETCHVFASSKEEAAIKVEAERMGICDYVVKVEEDR